MKPTVSKQRLYASLLILGACVLLYRTLCMMFFEDAFKLLVTWVILLLLTEFIIDLMCLLAAVRWWIIGERAKRTLALRLGAMAAIFHALRVLVYVLGRTGPWLNFDVKPEYHATYEFEWFWVYFAATLSILGLLGVLVIWLIIRHKKRKNTMVVKK